MKRLLTLLALSFALALTATAQLRQEFQDIDVNQLRKLQMVHVAVTELYVDTVNQGKLTEAGIRGMLNSLDPHSSYSDAKETKAINEPLQGNFEGIGVQFNMLEDTLVVIQTIRKGPSEKVGILAGDRIVKVNEQVIAGVKMERDSIMRVLRGPKGTVVKLGIIRRGVPDMIWFNVTRDKIPMNTLDAAYIIRPGVGYIHLDRFGATSGAEVKEAIEKLSLSDSALQFEPENSPVLGYGVRIGFLGLLHMDIIRERLEREYNLDLIVTNPSTDYQVSLTNGEELDIKSASELPDPVQITEVREPWINGEIVVPQGYIGAVIQLIVTKRGRQKNLSYIDERALISFIAPLANLLTDFYDQLKSVTSGYGSFNYELAGYQPEDLVRVDFYVAGEMVDALSVMCHRSEAPGLGREIVKKLKDVVPRQSFEVALQAAIGGRFIARENIGAYRKDVTGYLYGGDVSRKKKLLAKQARGKKRMKRFGKVDIPSEAFTIMLRRD